MTWQWALGSTSSSLSSSSGLLRLVDVGDVAMGVGCCDPGGCHQGARARRRRGRGNGRALGAGRSLSRLLGLVNVGDVAAASWQLRPVRFGVQAARGGVTHLGCTQWVLVVVVGSDSSGWW